jgi:hypothetical protein
LEKFGKDLEIQIFAGRAAGESPAGGVRQICARCQICIPRL